MTELAFSTPSPKQELVMRSTKKFIGFGGARGGGKSWMVRTKAILLCVRYAGIKILIVRRTYPELQGNHIDIMRPMLKGVARYNQQQKRFTFENGSTIKFGYCDNDAAVDQYQGQEYDVIFFDEATQLSEIQMRKIAATCRGVNGLPKRIYYTCNPGGQGHEYIKRIFIDRIYVDNEKPEDYYFVQSLLTDNQALMESDPDYIHYLESLPPKLRQAWLYGDWDVYEGQFFEEFCKAPDRELCAAANISVEEAMRQRRFTHVIEPFEIPKTWEIFRSFDWGYSRPYSCDYWAVDFDGRAYLILQNYGCTGEPNEGLKKTPAELFPQIAQFEREHRWLKGRRIHGIADPAIWDASTGPSTAEIAEINHVYFAKGDNSRMPGWMQVHYRMAFDGEGFPMIYFFNTCHHAIRTLPLLTYSETNPEDLDTDGEDHFADSMRYFCMSRPIKPRIPAKKKTRSISPLNL